MRLLVDTNVLIRAVGNHLEDRRIANEAVRILSDRHAGMVVVPQVVYEWWVVATRPRDVNGLDLDVRTARVVLNTFEESFATIPDPVDLYSAWRRLILQYDIAGKPAHDARLVAAMQLHAIDRLLTFNVQHFKRFPFVKAISPVEIASGASAF